MLEKVFIAFFENHCNTDALLDLPEGRDGNKAETRRTQGGGSKAWPQGVASAELQLQQLQQLHVFGSRIFKKVMQEWEVKVELSSG